ncbi:hypothetical protein [Corynebacterium falsenii]|uniref:hypothetical protein n=1 Tax=Corynebacterium falsenii TaxID=108486 RepID=UPI003FCF936E
MSKVKTADHDEKLSTPMVVTVITAVGLLLLALLYVGLSRYFNSQELAELVEGAEANGQSYSVVIHNELTGSYSFNIDQPKQP